MKKVFIILIDLFIVFTLLYAAFIVFYPFVHYDNMEKTTLNVWMLDNTVPNPDYREHIGLVWLLNSKKIYNEKTNAPFEYDEDYYGFYPIDPFNYEVKELPEGAEYPDLIYLADTYGVYVDDYFKDNLLGTKSDIIYGGLKEDDITKINNNLGNNNTIIGEFNVAGYPTNKVVSRRLGEIFRMDWTGWTARYFTDLSKGVEVPVWAIEFYENSTGLEWEFTGEGIVLVHEFQETVVFEKGKDFGNDYVFLTFDEKYHDEFGIDDDILYEYWFEFAEANASAEVLAEFTFDVTEQGKQRLAELGLSPVFPAIVRNQNPLYTSYYFAGDFIDGDFDYRLWDFYGYSGFKKALPMSEKGDNRRFFWKCYIPVMEKIIDDINIKVSLDNIESYEEDMRYNVKTTTDSFQIKTENGFEDMFIKGVNMGSSVPGKWYTQFPSTEADYLEWFDQIAGMNANTVRIYTLMAPAFYTALEHYNQNNPDNPLWLYQEIWPEEGPLNNDYLRPAYLDEYLKEIERVVDAVNGNIHIPYRRGRAYGIYTSDVSEYVLGYMVGRELEPIEVESTNEYNPGFSFEGDYLYCSPDASPTEAWLALCCDYLIDYEIKEYKWQHPVGIVSWPILDVTEHDSEWHISGDVDKVYNDKISIDINNINVKDSFEAGFFGAYHIYPNYPDFMNNEASYAQYEDDQGILRYGGYLQEFMQGHTKYPALVAEFGLATGMAVAHNNPDGYLHGGMTEQEQGEGIVRMAQAIRRENYAGAIIFEWSDEWAKKTWNTEALIIPFDRNILWHNMMDPEQNYGILAMEATTPKSEDYVVKGDDKISSIKLQADEEYLYINVELKRDIDFENESFAIGLDTYDREVGNFMLPYNNYHILPVGLEYLIRVDGYDDASILVTPSYNIAQNKYQSQETYLGVYENINRLVNMERITKSGDIIDEIRFDYSKLRKGDFEGNSHYAWNISGNKINFRIPWMTLNFTDPSDMRVLDDERIIYVTERNKLNTAVTDGIVVYSVLVEKEYGTIISILDNLQQKPFAWESWNLPDYAERTKDSYDIIAEYFGSN